jgi:hypothetical protein
MSVNITVARRRVGVCSTPPSPSRNASIASNIGPCGSAVTQWPVPGSSACCAWDELRGVTHQLERLSAAIESAVHDQGRHSDRRKHVADVERKAQFEQWTHRAGAETCPLDLANPGDVSRIP